MGEKDVTARHLMHFADVFADIVNGSIFNLTGGWPSPLVRPEDLVDVPTSNVSVSGGRVRGLERDVAKLWTAGGTVICLTGLEHQTRVDPDMPFRVFGYEGADYHRQIAERDAEAKVRARDGSRRGKRRNKLYPVLTIVLYFGTKRPWPKNRLRLLDRFPDMREFMRPLANDCHLNMVDVPRLKPDQRAAYRSDFRAVVDYACRIWQDKDFEPGDQELVHVEETVRFLSALTGDRGLIKNLPNIIQQGGKPMTVRNVFGEVRKQGRAEGRAEGMQIGRAQGGLNMLVSLVHDGLLRLGDAAKKAGMSEDEFKIRMREREGAGEA